MPFATSIGLSTTFGATLTSMAMIGNSGFKLLTGVLGDVIGAKRAFGLMVILTGIGFAILVCGAALPPLVLMVGALLVGASYSLVGVGLSTVCRETLGAENFDIAYAYVTMAVFVGCAAGVSIFGYAYDAFQSYQPSSIVGSGICVIVLVLLWQAYRQAFHPKQEQRRS